MTKPSECIWCGLELLDDTTHDTIFSCGTVQHPRSDCWSQSTGCEEIMRSRERIQRADQDIEMVKAREANAVTALQSHTRALESRIQQAVAVLATLRAIQRHEVTPYTSRQVSWERTSDGPWILQREVEAVVDDLVRVLEGET
jgi:hypothetical protein